MSAALLVLTVCLGACTGGSGPSPSPSSSPSVDPSPSPSVERSPSPSVDPSPSPSVESSPTPSGAGEVESAAQAAALVLASDARFAGIGPIIPGLIGQPAWYEASETPRGFFVMIRIGWGDCPAGCIENHIWRYAVTRDGAITLTGEEGPALPADVGPPEVTGEGTLAIVLVGGPTCAVETQPPQPGCEPRPVANGTAVVRDGSGAELGRAKTDEMGRARITLPAGVYIVEALPLDGLMGTPEPVAAWALPSGSVPVTLAYDTGIR